MWLAWLVLVVLPCPICGRPIWQELRARTANGSSTEGTEDGKERARRFVGVAHFVPLVTQIGERALAALGMTD